MVSHSSKSATLLYCRKRQRKASVNVKYCYLRGQCVIHRRSVVEPFA